MFGSVGFPELLILAVLVAVGAAVTRRGALAIAGPALVLRKFEVNPAGSPAVLIEGRASGLVAWMLTTLGLDTLTTLTVTEQEVSFKSAGLTGELRHLVPTTNVSSTHCGYSQPIWLLVVGGLMLVLSLLLSLSSRDGSVFVAGIFLAAVCGVLYLLQRKIAITVETTGGILIGVAFKPSAIEQVSVNLERALEAVRRINAIVLARSHGVQLP